MLIVATKITLAAFGGFLIIESALSIKQNDKQNWLDWAFLVIGIALVFAAIII